MTRASVLPDPGRCLSRSRRTAVLIQQHCLELLPSRPTHLDFRTLVEDHQSVAMGQRSELANAVEIDHCRPVNAKEPPGSRYPRKLWIEPRERGELTG